jgi:hypothetical protein
MEANSGIPVLNKSLVLKADNSIVECGNCGWEWEFSLGGESPLVCHQCKGDLENNAFSEARGYRRKKRRKGLNKAVGYIPAVAAVRYVKDRREANRMEERRLARRRSKPKKRMRRPTPKMRPKPNTTRRFDTSNPKLLPLPPSALNKQGSSASIEQPKNNKMLYIVGGVAVLGIVAFIIYKRK